MTLQRTTTVVKDVANRKIAVTRYFEAGVAEVWRAWTERELLDRWWAPKPYRAETRSLEFVPGGMWLYAMVSPEGERHWCRVDIRSVEAERSFSSVAVFSDENGVPNDVIPPMHWDVHFRPEGSGTTVLVEISFEHDEDVAKILEMGFEAGFTMALGNLDELFAGR